MKFWKMSGAGNDFVLVEKSSLKGRSPAALAKLLSDRKSGVGADGLLVVSNGAVPGLDYYNADGSEAFCGNGTRCTAFWLMKRRKSSSLRLRTKAGFLSARSTASGRVAVTMPEPGPVRRAGKAFLINTGTPHAVLFVKNTVTSSVESVGRALRRKHGANVNFVQKKGSGLKIRTYEKGVEAETLACGSGIVAAAVVAWTLGLARPPIKVKALGGDLRVSFTPQNGRALALTLEGPAEIVFSGEVTP